MELAEEALALLAENRAVYRSTEQDDVIVGRIQVAGSLGAFDHDQTKLASTYLRYVGVVESYLDSLGGQIWRETIKSHSSVIRQLVTDMELRATSTWDERKSSLSRYHSIDIQSFGRWSEFDAAIDVRNAIAHGLGSLTMRQRNSKDRDKIRAIGVSVVGDRIDLDWNALDRCYLLCRELILYVDAARPVELRHTGWSPITSDGADSSQ
ncbi:hypothetical protein [Saccharothrix sp. Mg75]|uniref:hypothetical protein n=1 Tax=Saccharothrix sp. Mg75 TaxID=3445357 RepID=UPI003EE9BF87